MLEQNALNLFVEYLFDGESLKISVTMPKYKVLGNSASKVKQYCEARECGWTHKIIKFKFWVKQA